MSRCSSGSLAAEALGAAEEREKRVARARGTTASFMVVGRLDWERWSKGEEGRGGWRGEEELRGVRGLIRSRQRGGGVNR
jgi:hypothetical protein